MIYARVREREKKRTRKEEEKSKKREREREKNENEDGKKSSLSENEKKETVFRGERNSPSLFFPREKQTRDKRKAKTSEAFTMSSALMDDVLSLLEVAKAPPVATSGGMEAERISLLAASFASMRSGRIRDLVASRGGGGGSGGGAQPSTAALSATTAGTAAAAAPAVPVGTKRKTGVSSEVRRSIFFVAFLHRVFFSPVSFFRFRLFVFLFFVAFAGEKENAKRISILLSDSLFSVARVSCVFSSPSNTK